MDFETVFNNIVDDIDDEETIFIMNTTEDQYYKIMFGEDYKNNEIYKQMINKTYN